MVRMEVHHHSLGAHGARPTSPGKESHVEHRGKRCCEGSPRSSDGTKGCSPESGCYDGSFMESEIKGLSLRNYPIALRAIRGDDVADRTIASLSHELREGLLRGTILASGWYPVAYKRELHQAGAKVTGEPGLARVMGYEMTKRDLSGIYRT